MCKRLIIASVLLSVLILPTSAFSIHKNQDVINTSFPDSVILFRFANARKMFFKDYKDNHEAITKAGLLIKQHIKALQQGKAIITIEGFCTSFKTEMSNLKMAKSRSNQVKSYYITHMGMKEAYYRTRNHAHTYKGNRDIVALLKIDYLSLESSKDSTETTVKTSAPIEYQDSIKTKYPTTSSEKDTTVLTTSVPASQKQKAKSQWIIKTNLPFWGLVVPNMALEYGFQKHWSLDFPIYYMPITVDKTYRFRILAVQPSLRYWLKPEYKGHFLGLHLTAGQFNIAINNKTRYQDKHGMYGVGVDYGYALRFNHRWGLELNIGYGYLYTKYNKYYNIDNSACYGDGTKHYQGITRLGISITYLLNNNGK